jgi:hypothetical protein
MSCTVASETLRSSFRVLRHRAVPSWSRFICFRRSAVNIISLPDRHEMFSSLSDFEPLNIAPSTLLRLAFKTNLRDNLVELKISSVEYVINDTFTRIGDMVLSSLRSLALVFQSEGAHCITIFFTRFKCPNLERWYIWHHLNAEEHAPALLKALSKFSKLREYGLKGYPFTIDEKSALQHGCRELKSITHVVLKATIDSQMWIGFEKMSRFILPNLSSLALDSVTWNRQGNPHPPDLPNSRQSLPSRLCGS